MKKLKLDLDRAYFRKPGFGAGTAENEPDKPNAPLCALGKLHAADGEFTDGYDLWSKLAGDVVGSSHIFSLNDKKTPALRNSIRNHYAALRFALTELVKTGKVILKAADPKVQKELKKANLPFVEE